MPCMRFKIRLNTYFIIKHVFINNWMANTENLARMDEVKQQKVFL